MRTIIINTGFFRTIVATALLLLVIDSSSAATHEYTIAVDASLERLIVEARFAVPTRDLSARSRAAPQFLRSARDCGADEKLRTRNRRLVLAGRGIECLAYEFDLRRSARAGRYNGLLDPANIVVSPTLWMWRPPLAEGDEILVRFQLPGNVKVSVPWQPVHGVENTYRLTASPESGVAIAVFGDFAAQVVTVAGAQIDVTLLRTEREIDAAEIADWVRQTASNITLTYGRFPNPAARVVVIPVGGNRWGGASPVPFGRVVRDGGETIELLINENRPIAEFYEEWTPTHEFSHLMLPYLRRDQRWISEGFATYYQNLLLARSGQYTAAMAWQKLYEGLERGRDSAPSLSPNDAAAGEERNTRMKIYWSGVALALMADVELRRRSGGAESLDSVLDQLQRCCLPSNRSWSGRELFRQLDTLQGEALFMDLYRKYADTAGFPDARPLLGQLGVIPDGGAVRISETAELAGIRRQITAVKPSAATESR